MKQTQALPGDRRVPMWYYNTTHKNP